jgi:hypothetical protein
MRIFQKSFVNTSNQSIPTSTSIEEAREHQIISAIEAECEEALNDPQQ